VAGLYVAPHDRHVITTAPWSMIGSAVSDPTSVVIRCGRTTFRWLESLEALIRCQGWRPEVFQSAEEFSPATADLSSSFLILDVTLPD